MATVIRPPDEIPHGTGEDTEISDSMVYADTIHRPIDTSLIVAEEPGEREKKQSPTLTSGIFQQVSFSRFPKIIPPRLHVPPAETRKKIIVGFSGVVIGAAIAISVVFLSAQRNSPEGMQVAATQSAAPVETQTVVSVVVAPPAEILTEEVTEAVSTGPVQQFIPSGKKLPQRKSSC